MEWNELWMIGVIDGGGEEGAVMMDGSS